MGISRGLIGASSMMLVEPTAEGMKEIEVTLTGGYGIYDCALFAGDRFCG